jgi:hypothetical protein
VSTRVARRFRYARFESLAPRHPRALPELDAATLDDIGFDGGTLHVEHPYYFSDPAKEEKLYHAQLKRECKRVQRDRLLYEETARKAADAVGADYCGWMPDSAVKQARKLARVKRPVDPLSRPCECNGHTIRLCCNLQEFASLFPVMPPRNELHQLWGWFNTPTLGRLTPNQALLLDPMREPIYILMRSLFGYELHVREPAEA